MSPIRLLGIRSGDSIIVEKMNPPGDLVAAMTGLRNSTTSGQASTGVQSVNNAKKRVKSPRTGSDSFAAPDLQQKNVKRK